AQRVLHATRDGFIVDVSLDDALSLELSQLLRQNLLCRAEEPSQLTEVMRGGGELVEDLRLPFGPDHLDRRSDRAIRETHSVHGVLHLVSQWCPGFEKVPTGKAKG